MDTIFCIHGTSRMPQIAAGYFYSNKLFNRRKQLTKNHSKDFITPFYAVKIVAIKYCFNYLHKDSNSITSIEDLSYLQA